MVTIKVMGDNTECCMDNKGVVTISGDNVNISGVVKESKEKCSNGSDTDKFIDELKNNKEFGKIIKDIVLDGLLINNKRILDLKE